MESITEMYRMEAQLMLLVLHVTHMSYNAHLELSLAYQDLIGYDQHGPESFSQ